MPQILTRYLETQYIDSFFSGGSLLLTTYARCISHEDEVRRDEDEGKANFHLQHQNYAVSGIQRAGSHSYMFCTSTEESDFLMRRFGTGDYFYITDVAGFAKAIGNQLPNLKNTQFGPCKYVSTREILRRTANPVMPNTALFENIMRGNFSGNIDEVFHRMNRELAENLNANIGPDPYFLKDHDKFHEEKEFRFIWTTSNPVTDPIVIQCPEAVQFCKRRSAPKS